MDLYLADQAYEIGKDGGPEIVCHNMYAQPKPPVDGRGYELLSTPGLSAFATLSSNVRGMYSETGLFGGDIFAVVGPNVVRINEAGVVRILGIVASSGNVTIASTRVEIAIAVEPHLYICDGESITQVTDEDLPNVTSVTYLNQRFIISDDNDRSYWSDLLDGGSFDGLNFRTAESKPDSIIRVMSDGERYFEMGEESIEVVGSVTNPTSGSDAFARLGGGSLPVGIVGPYAACVDLDSKALGFVGHNRVIYITTGYDLTPISTPFINEQLEAASRIDIEKTRCFVYQQSGTTHFVVNVPNTGTFVFVKQGGKWHTRGSQDGNWRADTYVYAFGKHYVANHDSNIIWLMSRATKTDNGHAISRKFSASLPARSVGAFGSLALDAFADVDTKVSMRFTDNGRDWSSWVDRDLTSPDFNALTTWRRLGKAMPPQRIFEFRVTDNAILRVQGVRMNDAAVR